MDSGAILAALRRKRSSDQPLLIPVIPDVYREEILLSRLSPDSLHDDEYVDGRIRGWRAGCSMRSEDIPLTECDNWAFDQAAGGIMHSSGRFFSITGLKVRHRYIDRELSWDQPIIEQPEVGILGVLAARHNGVLHFLLQGKEEPGNIGLVQLSPTVQATLSNYSRVHGGRIPEHLDLFLRPEPGSVVFSKLQSEDGGRFLYKSNLNMVLMAPEGTVESERFVWITLRQVARLMRSDNIVHSCTRSVLACLI